jgi:hypothetical protein
VKGQETPEALAPADAERREVDELSVLLNWINRQSEFGPPYTTWEAAELLLRSDWLKKREARLVQENSNLRAERDELEAANRKVLEDHGHDEACSRKAFDYLPCDCWRADLVDATVAAAYRREVKHDE